MEGVSKPSAAVRFDRTSRGRRFVVGRGVLVIDRDGLSVPFTQARRIAFWRGSARRRFGLVEVFTPREGWLNV